MEPLKIDWAKVESRFVTDELYENINAPKWTDLSASFGAGSTGEDDAWFCRPDCRHPRSAEDFLCDKWRTTPPTPKPKLRRDASKTEVLKTLTERNSNTTGSTANGNENVVSKPNADGNSGNTVKRRAAGAVLQLATPLRSPRPTQPASAPAAAKKRFDEDLENRDPNHQTVGTASKLRKEPVWSRAEKSTTTAAATASEAPGRRDDEEDVPHRRRLRSTLSARNLFAGKDLLAQISGFYCEIKRWITVRRGEHHVASDCEARKEEGVVVDGELDGDKEAGKEGLKTETESRRIDDDGNLNRRRRTAAGEPVKPHVDTAANGGNQPQPRPTTYANQLGQQDNVRSHPPSPQRFPSPMTRSKQCKPAAAATPSPLRPLNRLVVAAAPERTILGDLIFSTSLSPVREKNCNVIPHGGAAEAKPLDMLWFMKPCSYLGR